MTELEVTWKRILAVWWLMVWRGALGGFLIGAIAGFVAGFIVGVIYVALGGTDLQAAKHLGQYAGIAVSIPLGIWWSYTIFRMAFKKKYRGFRLAMIAVEP